jgi:hypothetical protein
VLKYPHTSFDGLCWLLPDAESLLQWEMVIHDMYYYPAYGQQEDNRLWLPGEVVIGFLLWLLSAGTRPESIILLLDTIHY